VANDFGGSFGGPVVIPHLYNGRNRTLFFTDYEDFRFPRSGVIQNTVPTAAMRNGDLSYLCTAGFTSGVCNDPSGQICDPSTGQPFQNNQITNISPIAQKLLHLYPLPNVSNNFTSNNYNVNAPANRDSNKFDVRGDQNFGSKLAVFARYTQKNINQLGPLKLLIPSSADYDHVRMLVASATYTLTPTLLNEFRFGLTNNVSGSSNSFDGKAFSSDETVVRGSIGAYEAISMDSIYYSLKGTAQAFTRQFLNSQTSSGPAFAWPATGTGGAGFGAPQYGTAYFGTADQVNWKEPYAVQWGLSVERNLGFNTGLRISYTGMKTTQLVWAPNWNQSLPSTIPYQLQPLSSRPFPNWGTVNSRDVGATAYYNAMRLEVSHRVGSGLVFDSTYTFARSLADNQGPSSNGGFCNENACNRSGSLYNRNLEYGNTYAPRHRWLTTVIYQLPFGGSQRFAKSSNPFVNALIGRWQMSNIFEVQSGPFLTPYFSGADPSGTGIGLQGRNQLPDRMGPVSPGNPNAGEWFLSSGFMCPGGDCQAGTSAAHPPIGRFGMASVGSQQGPGTIDWDLGLGKSFRLTEHATLHIEGSFVNVLNHINLGIPNMKIASANNLGQRLCGFGCITAAQGLYEFAGAREGQIGARIEF
jgi:hypothetical protein